MYTIFDYIKAFKNTPMNKMEWNIIDNLLCSILVYSKLKPFQKKEKFNDYLNSILEVKVNSKTEYMPHIVQELAKELVDSTRYKHLSVSNYIYQLDDKTQFSAISYKFDKTRIISFEGSDGTTIGWCENIRLAYIYPSYTQELAIEYLRKAIKDTDEKIYVVGHSKGGNLAMSAAMELDDDKFQKISKICNFDGPGFLKEEFTSNKYLRMKSKLINVLPVGSYVGCLMHNDGETIVVNSDAKGFSVHFPNTWEVFGPSFISTKLDARARYFNRLTSTGFDSLNRDDTKKVVEVLFEDLLTRYDSHIKITYKELVAVLENADKSNVKPLKVLGKINQGLFNYSIIGENINSIGTTIINSRTKKKK